MPEINALSGECGLMLLHYKDGDANARSVRLCSRNDAIGNVVVMFAVLAVWGTKTALSDLSVAALIAEIFLTLSAQILRQAWAEYRKGADKLDLALEE